MAKFIELTTDEGAITVNIDHIMHFKRESTGTRIYFNLPGDRGYPHAKSVSETYQEVKALIHGSHITTPAN